MAEILSNGTPPALPSFTATQIVHHLDLKDLLLERGTTGLRRAGGYVREDLLPDLVGQRGIQVYKEMRDNSGVVGACLYATEMLLRKVPWKLQPADDSLLAAQYADFMDGVLFRDLDMPWSMQMSEIRSFLEFGFSYFELIFKRRLGGSPPLAADGRPQLPSCFDDGAIGLGKIAQRAQDTVLRWEFDDTGTLQGMHQLDPWAGRQAYLPYEKCLLFRATSWKDNPEGRSILRTAYRSWFLVKHLENIEAITAERDGTGIPVIGTPPQWFSGSATPEELAQLEMAKRIVRNLRNDEQSGVVHPLIYDLEGKPLFTISLMASPGTRAINTNEVIQRYELRIAQSMLTDLIFLGHEAVGSFALASSKTNMLGMALSGYLMAIADVFNRRAIPLLWRLNAYPEELMPTLTHGDVESVDLKEVGQFIKDYAQAGFDVTDLDDHVRLLVGFPEREEGTPVMAEQPPAPEQPVAKRRRMHRPRRQMSLAY